MGAGKSTDPGSRDLSRCTESEIVVAKLGRTPKPTAIRLLEGDRGHRGARPREPRPTVEALICPSKMSREAVAEWRRIVPQLTAIGLLTKLDRAMLALYCESWADVVELRLNILEFGRTFTTPNGYAMTRPEVRQLET